MKYCPNCRGEFQDWVEKCIDCNVELVDTLPPKTDPVPIEPMVTIAKYSTLVEANLIKEILESEGIRHVAVGELEPPSSWVSSYLIWSSSRTTSVACLRVREEDAEKAIKIAKSVTEIVPIAISEIDEEDEDADDEETAPRM